MNAIKFLPICVVLLLSACVQVRQGPSSPEERTAPEIPREPRYEPVPNQDTATVTALRAAPPLREPQIAQGTSLAADEQSLNRQSYARIGDAWVPAAAGDPREWVAEQARRVGADKVLVYAPDPEGTTRASYYVRYRLPFGATFRTVTADERTALGLGGVQIGEVVRGTPASEANLRKGDFVVKFNGKAIADRAAFEKLLREHLGSRVTLTVNRDGVVFSRLVRLGSIARAAVDGKH